MTPASKEIGATSLDAAVADIDARWRDPGASAAHMMCDRHPADAVALVLVDDDGRGTHITYGKLRERSERIAGALRARGIGEGDRVATLMGKSADLVATILGIWRLGAVYAPLFTAFAPDGVRLRLDATGAKLVVADAAQAPKVAQGPDVPWRLIVAGDGVDGMETLDEACADCAPVTVAHVGGGDGPIVHMLTSGTTGPPKGVVHPLAYMGSWEGYFTFALAVPPDARFWNIADPGWAYGLYAAVAGPLALGIASHLHTSAFTPDSAVTILRERGITDFAAAPTVLRAMRAAGCDISGLALRRISTAGEPLTPEVGEWTRAQLGVDVRDHYGQTEVAMVAGQAHHPELARPVKEASMGPALPGWTLAVLTEESDDIAPRGELGRLAIDVAGSPFLTFSGYHPASSDRFTPDGRYYLTGDSAFVDADGDISFGARDDDVIIMAGYRIGPTDVESVLLKHEAVADCAVVAVPDEVRGEVIKAVVVTGDGHEPSEALGSELTAWVKERYAAHAAPRIVEFMDALPRTPSGKVQRFLLRR